MSPEIVFKNHSCIQINHRQVTLLCDPWFSGSVFNHSWKLLQENKGKINGLRDELAIWVSHEHPDHFHIPTLKEIRSQFQGKIRLFYRKQDNSNIKNEVTRLGFDFIELSPGERLKVTEGLHLTSFPEGTDTAVVIEAGDKVILHQNDTLLGKKSASLIKSKFPVIHLWLFQFSLAGYYGNENDVGLLRAARRHHLHLIKYYFQIFTPKIYIPFASFIYFCKDGNSYLNKYRVTPQEAVTAVNPQLAQVLWLEDRVLWQDWNVRNTENLEKWSKVWSTGCSSSNLSLSSLPSNTSSEHIIRAETPSTEQIIKAVADYLFDPGMAPAPKVLTPRKVSVQLRESGRVFEINLWKKECRLRTDSHSAVDAEINAEIDAEVGDDDFLFFCRFPWGADTLNITGNLKINNQFIWRWFAYLKHCRYVYSRLSPVLQALIAISGALVNTVKYHFLKARLKLRSV